MKYYAYAYMKNPDYQILADPRVISSLVYRTPWEAELALLKFVDRMGKRIRWAKVEEVSPFGYPTGEFYEVNTNGD